MATTHRYEVSVEGDTYCQYPSAASPKGAAWECARKSKAKKGALVLVNRCGDDGIALRPTRRYRVTVAELFAYEVQPEAGDAPRPAVQAASGTADSLVKQVRSLTPADDGAFLEFVNARCVDARAEADPYVNAFWQGLLTLASTPR